MATYYTAEETLNLSIKTMGESLGRLHYALSNELVWLYTKWGEYVELFGKKPSRIDLINKAGGLFFRIIQDLLWDDTLLHIARLTDPRRSAGNNNLTICCLSDPNLICNKNLHQTIEKLLKIAIEKSKFARDWRNRRIAHKDFALAMKDDAKPLMPASRAQVKEVLSSIAEVLNSVSRHYKDSEMRFQGIGNSKGAVSLVYVIDDGLQAEQERRDRHLRGEYHPDDYKQREI